MRASPVLGMSTASSIAVAIAFACSDSGPAPASDAAGLWRGSIRFSAGHTSPIELLVHPLASNLTILGHLNEQVGVTGLAAQSSDGKVQLMLTIYTPDVPSYRGTLQLRNDKLSGALVFLRDTTDSVTTVDLTREPVTNRNIVGRWVMTASVRSHVEKPQIVDTLVFTRGGSYSQTRTELWTSGYSCGATAIGIFRVQRDSVFAVQRTPPTIGCLVRYRDTLRLANGHLTRRFRTGVDSIADTYVKR